MGIRNQKVGNVLILVSFRNGLPRRPVGPPRNDRLFRQSQLHVSVQRSQNNLENKKSEYPEGYSDGGSVMIGLGKVLSYQWLTGSQQELLSVKLNNLINYFSQSQYNEWLP